MRGGWGPSHGVGSSSSCPLLFFPCLECSGSEVLPLSWGVLCSLRAQGGRWRASGWAWDGLLTREC